MRDFLDTFERRFGELHLRTCDLVSMIPEGKLYWQPRATEALFPINSCGEYVLRSAAAVESTFGGITAKLWDDPFEWTLPEMLATNGLVLEYLAEVESTRVRGFAFLGDDADLRRLIPAPEKLRSIFDILLDTIARSDHYLGRAYGVFRLFSDDKLPRR
ncbi:MAG: hypothetical protein IPN69_11300 [Acidobacteria bacterium]|nr:hypothetical protein [Acidobacteriota bacterium]